MISGLFTDLSALSDFLEKAKIAIEEMKDLARVVTRAQYLLTVSKESSLLKAGILCLRQVYLTG